MRNAWLLAALLTLAVGCSRGESTGADAPAAAPDTGPSSQAPAEAPAVPIEERLLAGVDMSSVESNGIRMRIARMGEGPAVLLAHGWPESWYSWRHQLKALADAGYQAIAPDMRGYGGTDAPAAVEAYDVDTVAADMVGILDALGIDKAVMIGHDWGAAVAARTVLRYPDRFRALVLMSVPYTGRAPENPMERMRANIGDNFFYMLYHNEPGGVAEAEYDSDPRGLLFRLYQSPNSPRKPPEVTDPRRAAGGWIPRLGEPLALPDWLSEADLDYYVSQFERTGFRGGVNYYRNLERDWLLGEDLAGATIDLPTLFIAGAQDIVIGGASKADLEAMMASAVPGLADVMLFPSVGHWVQQEAAARTNDAILAFLATLDGP
jgi:pimeloyl-ACP methyl ester carboxylesterase